MSFWNCFDILNFFGANKFSITKIEKEGGQWQKLKIESVKIPEIYREYLMLNGWFYDSTDNFWYSEVEIKKNSTPTIRPSLSEISIEELDWDDPFTKF